MIRLLDGPAEGETFAVRRAPLLLRIVHDVERDKWDALDQVEDNVNVHERVYVYKRMPDTWSVCFVRPGGRYEMGEYRHVDVQLDDEVLKVNEAWQEWAVGYVGGVT